MPTFRMDRINEEIRRELAQLIHTVKDPRVPEFISITQVKTTPDLKMARVYFSVLEKDPKSACDGLASSAKYLRGALAKSLKLRYTPQLVFVADEAIKYGIEINQKLSELNIKQDEDE